LNGTSGDVLQTQNEAALAAIEQAIEQLAAAAPHGRDYYVQEHTWDQLVEGMTAFHAAATQHTARVAALTSVRDGLREIVRGIRGQNRVRATAKSVLAEMIEDQKKGR
jgi:hypothetical protein